MPRVNRTKKCLSIGGGCFLSVVMEAGRRRRLWNQNWLRFTAMRPG